MTTLVGVRVRNLPDGPYEGFVVEEDPAVPGCALQGCGGHLVAVKWDGRNDAMLLCSEGVLVVEGGGDGEGADKR